MPLITVDELRWLKFGKACPIGAIRLNDAKNWKLVNIYLIIFRSPVAQGL
jgi:hypothetical protein